MAESVIVRKRENQRKKVSKAKTNLKSMLKIGMILFYLDSDFYV